MKKRIDCISSNKRKGSSKNFNIPMSPARVGRALFSKRHGRKLVSLSEENLRINATTPTVEQLDERKQQLKLDLEALSSHSGE